MANPNNHSSAGPLPIVVQSAATSTNGTIQIGEGSAAFSDGHGSMMTTETQGLRSYMSVDPAHAENSGIVTYETASHRVHSFTSGSHIYTFEYGTRGTRVEIGNVNVYQMNTVVPGATIPNIAAAIYDGNGNLSKLGISHVSGTVAQRNLQGREIEVGFQGGVINSVTNESGGTLEIDAAGRPTFYKDAAGTRTPVNVADLSNPARANDPSVRQINALMADAGWVRNNLTGFDVPLNMSDVNRRLDQTSAAINRGWDSILRNPDVQAGAQELKTNYNIDLTHVNPHDGIATQAEFSADSARLNLGRAPRGANR